MTEQEQIEELRRTIYNVRSKVNGIATAGDIAEALYEAGYHKGTHCRECIVNVITEGVKAAPLYEKTRKETAKEILQSLYNKCYDINDETGESMGCFVSDDDIIDLAKQYGVEVTDNDERRD